ncbi:MAG: hypothetical protein U0441_16020 [Polyangiaceae bacterium]
MFGFRVFRLGVGVLGAAALFGGCGPAQGGECTPAPMPDSPTAADSFADGDGQWILKDPSGLCAVSGSWQGVRLWKGTVAGAPVGGTMATYCLYTWTDPMNPPDPTTLPAEPKARDRRAITPQSATVQGWAREAFLKGLRLPVQAPAGPDSHVRVVVADTEGDSSGPGVAGPMGTNTHGRLMADLVKEIACPAAGSCAVDVETRLALPRVRDAATGRETLVSTGGDFGRISDLTLAVARAVEAYYGEVDLGGGQFPDMLALSLSVGFEAQAAPAADEDFSADEVTLNTLRAFSCHGGLSFAAAGNHGGMGSRGLLLPAAFQDQSEPTAAECEALLGDKLPPALEETYQAQKKGAHLRRPYSGGAAPIVHGVGGVDQGGLPIKKSRENACPHYAALGLGWSEEGQTSYLLTGSSVPTAVVAGFFAAAAAQEGASPPYSSAHPQAIVDGIGQSSPASVFDEKGPCGGAWQCGDLPWIGGPAGAAPALQNVEQGFPAAHFESLATSSESLSSGVGTCDSLPLCEGAGLSAVSLIFPQPNDIPCVGGCYLRIADIVFQIDPAMRLQDVKLALYFADGTRQIVDLTSSPQTLLSPGTRYDIQLGGVVTANLRGARALVSGFDVSGNRTVSEQVLFVQ